METDITKDVAGPDSSDARIIWREANEETIEIFEAFSTEFLYFLRHTEGSIEKLESLAIRGNNNASLIAKYLKTQPLAAIFHEKRAAFLKDAKNTSVFATVWGALDLKWSDFTLTENNHRVSFSCDAFMHDTETTVRSVRRLLSMHSDSPLRKKFLQEILTDWLKAQGYKLKRYTELSGRYYCITSIVYHCSI